ncbi:MAG TPA: FAD-dependent oxidoreductase [Rubrobacteraceae bacterium]|nr:FAD-dependent oxidoreductase [Rubrobacteraceae bacterium]
MHYAPTNARKPEIARHVERESCVVLGAGISGLLAARELRAAGWRVVILEKNRRVGGRMATRRMGPGTFDYGAQFLTIRSERIGRLVEEWLAAGVIQEWSRGFTDAEGELARDGYPRYCGSEGMASIPEYLARDLDVRVAEVVTTANVINGAWEVRTATGSCERAGALLLTAPVPESLAVLAAGDVDLAQEVQHRLEKISYSPCLALTALLDGPTGVPEPGGVQIKGEPLDWIGDNRQKGISEAPAVTVNAGPRWSREHFGRDEKEITYFLLTHAGDRLGEDLVARTRATCLARWRYSWVEEGHDGRYLAASERPPLLFAGDAFGGAKVEGAALSGLAAADRLLGRTG